MLVEVRIDGRVVGAEEGPQSARYFLTFVCRADPRRAILYRADDAGTFQPLSPNATISVRRGDRFVTARPPE